MSDQTNQPQVTSSATEVPGGTEIDVKIIVPTPAGWAPPDLPVVPVDTPDAAPVPASTLAPDVPVITPPVAPDTSPAGTVAPESQPPSPALTPAVDIGTGAVVTYTFPDTGTGRPLTQTGVVVGRVELDQADGTTRPAYRVGWLATISDPIIGADLVEVT